VNIIAAPSRGTTTVIIPRITAPKMPPVHNSGGTEANKRRDGNGNLQMSRAEAARVSEVMPAEIDAAQSMVAPRWANWELSAACIG
jgi:hypothetical protein